MHCYELRVTNGVGFVEGVGWGVGERVRVREGGEVKEEGGVWGEMKDEVVGCVW